MQVDVADFPAGNPAALQELMPETTNQGGTTCQKLTRLDAKRKNYFPLGEYLVKASITGFAAAGLLVCPERISLASMSFP